MHYSFISLPRPGAVYRHFRPLPGMQFSSLVLLFLVYGLTLLGLDSLLKESLVSSQLVWSSTYVLTAGLALWGCSYWAMAPAPGRRLNCCAQVATGAVAGLLWSMIWLTLLAWVFLKVFGVVGFAPLMAWRWMRRGSLPQAWGALVGWAVA